MKDERMKNEECKVLWCCVLLLYYCMAHFFINKWNEQNCILFLFFFLLFFLFNFVFFFLWVLFIKNSRIIINLSMKRKDPGLYIYLYFYLFIIYWLTQFYISIFIYIIISFKKTLFNWTILYSMQDVFITPIDLYIYTYS